MKAFKLYFLVAWFLLFASLVHAGPITTGVWSTTVAPNDPTAFYTGISWDGANKGIGYLLGSGYEYLNDGNGNAVGFEFGDQAIEDLHKIGGITAWTNGILQMTDGIFQYDSGTGRFSDSQSMGVQYALFRLIADPTYYVLGIEDILLSEDRNDHDYNDAIYSFRVQNPPPTPTPEPASLLLLGSGMIIVARKVKHRNTR